MIITILSILLILLSAFICFISSFSYDIDEIKKEYNDKTLTEMCIFANKTTNSLRLHSYLWLIIGLYLLLFFNR
jgi:uncharacterized membrane protein